MELDRLISGSSELVMAKAEPPEAEHSYGGGKSLFREKLVLSFPWATKRVFETVHSHDCLDDSSRGTAEGVAA